MATKRYITGKDGTKLEVRKPRMADLEPLTNYINELSDERTYILWQGEHAELAQEIEYIANILKCISDGTCVHLLVVDGKKVVGAGGIKAESNVKSHVAELNIALLKKYRSNGFGESLLSRVVKDAKKHIKGLKIISLEVFGCNEVGKSLYRKLGFVKHGSLPGGIYWRGKYVDADMMYLRV